MNEYSNVYSLGISRINAYQAPEFVVTLAARALPFFLALVSCVYLWSVLSPYVAEFRERRLIALRRRLDP